MGARQGALAVPAELEPLFGKVRFSRIGLKLAERFPKGFRWQHEAAIALAGTGGKPHFELDAALAQEWYHGRDLYPEQPPAGDECIVTYQGQPLGIAKRIGSRIKNNLRASWCATARWIFTCNRSGAGEPHPRRQNNANNIPIVIRYYSNHFQVALFRLPVRISPPEKKKFLAFDQDNFAFLSY